MDKLKQELLKIIKGTWAREEIKKRFLARLREGNLTRDENEESHFCVFFAGVDFKTKKVFIGHHKKADIWLFNGGHIDNRELPIQTMIREMGEEWNIKIQNLKFKTQNLNSKIKIKIQNLKLNKLRELGIVEELESLEPELLTITEIDNSRVKCRRHFDIWYFVPLDMMKFKPEEKLMAKEFYCWGWKSLGQARELMKRGVSREALGRIEEISSW